MKNALIISVLMIPHLLFANQTKSEKPKLVVTIMIDQFRSDYIQKYKQEFLPSNQKNKLGGFLYLLENGSYFQYAQYDILQSMTAPGHATVMTGSYPYQNGIVLNEWYDAKLKKTIEGVDDSKWPITYIEKSDLGGKSPSNMLVNTVGDELKNAGYNSRVVSVALKDRSAIFMGGHRADIALWYEEDYKKWVTSSFYQKQSDHKKFLDQLNLSTEKMTPMKFKSKFENDLGSPFGGYLTVHAAIEAIKSFELGKHKDPDILTISLSSHDIVGHRFDSNSPQMKEMTLHEDQNISDLLNFLNSYVEGGLKNVVVALSADHGVAGNVEYLNEHNHPAGRITSATIKDVLEEKLNKKFGKLKSKWIVEHVNFNVYFTEEAFKKVKRVDLENEAKKALSEIEGVRFVFSKTDYEEGKLPPQMFERLIKKTYFEGRSGDVIIIPKPYYINSSKMNTHMTGYSYDKTVPLFIMGEAFKKTQHPKIVEVVDLAPTLSYILGIIPPSANEGRVLTESFK